MKNLIMAIAAFFGFNYATAHEPIVKPKLKTSQKTKIAPETTRTKKVEKVEKVEKAVVKKVAPSSVKATDKKKESNTPKNKVAAKSKK